MFILQPADEIIYRKLLQARTIFLNFCVYFLIDFKIGFSIIEDLKSFSIGKISQVACKREQKISYFLKSQDYVPRFFSARLHSGKKYDGVWCPIVTLNLYLDCNLKFLVYSWKLSVFSRIQHHSVSCPWYHQFFVYLSSYFLFWWQSRLWYRS